MCVWGGGGGWEGMEGEKTKGRMLREENGTGDGEENGDKKERRNKKERKGRGREVEDGEEEGRER